MEENAEKLPLKEETKKKTNKYSFIKMLQGEFLLEDYLVKQLGLILLIVGLSAVSITNNYDCGKKLTKIQILTDSLKHLEYENLILSTNLITRSRQSQIETLLKEKGIDLETSKTPAIEIRK